MLLWPEVFKQIETVDTKYTIDFQNNFIEQQLAPTFSKPHLHNMYNEQFRPGNAPGRNFFGLLISNIGHYSVFTG